MPQDLVIERSVKGGSVERRRYPNAFSAYAQLAHELGQHDEGLPHLARLGRTSTRTLPFEATIGDRRWVLMAPPRGESLVAAGPAPA